MLLCIDGGGTGSRARLYSDDGQVLAEGKNGPCNANNNLDQAVDSIHNLRCDVLGKVSVTDDTLIDAAIAAAGLVNPQVRQRFVAALPKFASLKVMPDGFAALVGASHGKPAGLVAIGTGAVAHRYYEDGRSVQRDGWGWMGGDRGSGCWIGQRAVRHALCVRDGTTEPSQLATSINHIIGNRDGELMAWLHDAGPTKFAALVPEVVALEGKGDWAAKDIVHRACKHIARLVDCLELPQDQYCYIAGSIGLAMRERVALMTETKLKLSDSDTVSGCRLVAIGAVVDDGFADHECAGA